MTIEEEKQKLETIALDENETDERRWRAAFCYYCLCVAE